MSKIVVNRFLVLTFFLFCTFSALAQFKGGNGRGDAMVGNSEAFVGFSDLKNSSFTANYLSNIESLSVQLPDAYTGDDFEVSIFDLSGKLILKSLHVSEKKTIIPFYAPKGIYLLIVRSKKSQFKAKFQR